MMAVALFSTTTNISAGGDYKVEHKNAIVIVMFGTTVEPALQGLINIQKRVQKRYPDTTVRIAFTSNIIRKIWQKRADAPKYIKDNPLIPKEILEVQTLLATVANLQDDGYRNIVIQPTHVTMGEEFLDLHTYIRGLLSMGTVKRAIYKPFNKVVLGRPALGTYGRVHPYKEDIITAAKAVEGDAVFAATNKAGLVYMAHGNEYMPTGGAILEFATRMEEMYPTVVTAIGGVEGYPGFNEVLAELKEKGIKKIIVKPFMVVAGDHAVNDIASHEEDSWKSLFEKEGFEVITITRGLGENNAFADIFVNSIADAAKDAGIKLK
jgi:sirohydrochlorin cobaltochelatase